MALSRRPEMRIQASCLSPQNNNSDKSDNRLHIGHSAYHWGGSVGRWSAAEWKSCTIQEGKALRLQADGYAHHDGDNPRTHLAVGAPHRTLLRRHVHTYDDTSQSLLRACIKQCREPASTAWINLHDMIFPSTTPQIATQSSTTTPPPML